MKWGREGPWTPSFICGDLAGGPALVSLRTDTSLCVRSGRSLLNPQSSIGKESACNAGDPGLIPGLGDSPGEGKGYPLQYSGLARAPKSRTRLSDFHFYFSEPSWALMSIQGTSYRSVCQLGGRSAKRPASGYRATVTSL